jgi:hypothetical protein
VNWRVCAHRPDAQLFPPTLVRGARATAPLGLRALARETRFGLLRRFFCRAPRGDPRETAKTGKFPAPTYIQCPKVPADRQFTLLWPHRIYIPSSCTRTTRTPSMLTMYEWLAVALTVRYLTAAFNTAVFCRLLRQGRKQAKSTGAFSKSYRTRTRGGRRCSSGARGWSWVHRGWVWVVNPPQGGFSAVKTETGRGKVNELERRKRSKSTNALQLSKSCLQHNTTQHETYRRLALALGGLARL